jgi:hypothetical protein
MNEKQELDWLAFQYIADELSPDETAAFELRLAEDQLAREAVARAVELSQAAAAAFDMQPVTAGEFGTVQPPARSWSVALWWMSCGAAACLAALMGYEAWRSGVGNVAAPGNAPSAELAAAWSETREQSRTAAYPELTSEILSSLKNFQDVATEVAAEPDAQEDETPSWIVAALSPDEAPPHDGHSGLEDESLNNPPSTKGEG